MHGFGPADGHLDAAGQAAGGHVFGKDQPLLAADPFDRRDQLLAIETGMFLIEIAGLDQMLGEQLLDMRRAVERRDELPEPRCNLGYQDIGETASGLVGGVCRRDFRGEGVLVQLFDDGAEQRFPGFEMVVERLSGQAGRLRGLLDRRAPKTMAAEHGHRGVENAGTRPHLTIFTKEDETSNHNAVENAGGCRSGGFGLIRREEHPRRACDYLGDTLRRRRGRCLKNKRHKQRRLTHLHELRRRQLAVLDLKIARRCARVEVSGKPGDGKCYHVIVESSADLRHPLGDRHHRSGGRSAARPAQQLDIGLPELRQRRGNVPRRIEIERHLALLEGFLLDDGFEQPVLVGEIDIQRSLGDAGRSRDFAHAGAVKPQIHEHLAGAGQNLTALGAVLVADQVESSGIGSNHWFSLYGKIPAFEMPRKELATYRPIVGSYLDRTVRSMLFSKNQRSRGACFRLRVPRDTVMRRAEWPQLETRPPASFVPNRRPKAPSRATLPRLLPTSLMLILPRRLSPAVPRRRRATRPSTSRPHPPHRLPPPIRPRRNPASANWF